MMNTCHNRSRCKTAGGPGRYAASPGLFDSLRAVVAAGNLLEVGITDQHSSTTRGKHNVQIR